MATSWLVHPLGIRIARAPVIPQVVAQAIERGTYELAEARCLLQLVHDKAKVLELGGGIGFLSALLRPRVAQYDLVEADERLLPVIAQTHQLNGVEGVRVHYGVATADAAALARGKQWLAMGDSFLTNSTALRWHRRREIEVPTISFPALLKETGADTLAIDIEGGEVGLFGDVDLSQVRSVAIELHPEFTGIDAVRGLLVTLSRDGLVLDVSSSRRKVAVLRRR